MRLKELLFGSLHTILTEIQCYVLGSLIPFQ